MDMNTIALIKGLAGNGGGGSSLPTNPAQDGTYALQNTVSSGTSTLSWASGGSSGGGVLVVNSDIQTMTLDKTYKEIADAGFAVLRLPDNEFESNYLIFVLIHFGPYDDGGTTMYSVEFWYHGMESMHFKTNSENGYPVYAE